MISKHAIIGKQVELGKNVTVEHFAVIEGNVEIGDHTEIGPHAVITGNTKIGCNNKIFQFVSIGSSPQDLKYKDEPTSVEIGDNNVIREFCSIHRGTINGHGKTKIGNRNFLMTNVHIAHDCTLHDQITMASNAALAGHVVVDDYALFGGYATVAQFCKIGAYSFLAGTTAVNKDVLPYTLVSSYHGVPARLFGLNVIGLRRRGFTTDTIKFLKQAYHLICRRDLLVKQIIAELTLMIADCPEIQRLVDALNKPSKFGVVR